MKNREATDVFFIGPLPREHSKIGKKESDLGRLTEDIQYIVFEFITEL
jgi:hypothetical protein